ncbi:putative pentatricopeptide repeat-containing protein At1g12700, mitochondrial [Malus domestica]|uniref:putative pentatricopeptide repeat-containing protein At1g12700, mitochondrial n=1 Tax=Malus domestica TaxID=3750 RepID=UPI0010AAF1D8|nr:putative pentatricopeptide repeat-containing protein At1g12700, mitochondrial [Malus domestica]
MKIKVITTRLPNSTDRFKQTHLESDNLIQTRCKSGKIRKDEALGYFDSMIQTKPLPSIWTFNCLFGALSKMKQYSAVVSMCKQLMGCAQFRLDVSTMTMFLNYMCRLNRMDLGFSVLAITLKYGLQPNAHSINTLLHGLCKNSSLAKAMEFFQEIEEKGYTCDEITYATIINGLCKAGKTSKALEILMKMWEDGRLKPNQDCYNPIIDSLCKERRIGEALTLFRDMISKNVVPNVFSYATLIHGLCNTSRWEEVLSLFGGMVDQGVKPNVVTYNTLIYAMCQSGRFEKAKSFLICMLNSGISPDVYTYMFLSAVFARKKEFKKHLLCWKI